MENDYKDLFCVNEKCSAALAASTGCDAVVASEAKHKARADSYLGYCRNPVSVNARQRRQLLFGSLPKCPKGCVAAYRQASRARP